MRKRARTVLCGGRSAMIVPTASIGNPTPASDISIMHVGRGKLSCVRIHMTTIDSWAWLRWVAVVMFPCGTALSAAEGVLSSCRVPYVEEAARCGEVKVPENPAIPDGRQLAISVAVLPARSGKALPDPIVVLMGGPGEEAIAAAADFARMFALLRNDRDILLVDQRGTGRSATLACKLYSDEDPATSLRDLFPVAAVERCREQLSARADLTQYSFARVAHDLEHIRRTLGYGRMNLSAGSSGTRAAQVYMRAYPQSVRTVLLHSIVPIDIPMPLLMAKTAEAAMESTLKACASESACNVAFPNIGNELRQIMERLDSGTVFVALSGGSESQLHRGRVGEWFRSQLYRPATAATLPWLIHQAYMGNWSPIVEGVLTNARDLDTALSIGVFFSITCSEDIVFVREQDVSPQTQGTFLGDYLLRQQQVACKLWPKASVPRNYRSPVRSSVPTLFVSGDSDGGTPLWMTDHAAKGFSYRAEVVMRNQGHTEWNECVAKLYEQFVRSGTARGIDTESCPAPPLPPFRTQ